MQKFKLGDEVILIKLDEELAKEEYDQIGLTYSYLLYKKGIITNVNTLSNKYVVFFNDMPKNWEEWYCKEDEIILASKAGNILYGKKD